MPRRARATPGGYVYHVLTRSVAGLPLFRKEADFEAFERIMIEAHGLHPLRILGWCAMRTHWHFVVWSREEGEVTAFFRWLAHTHAMRWHVAHNTVGRGTRPLLHGMPVRRAERADSTGRRAGGGLALGQSLGAASGFRGVEGDLERLALGASPRLGGAGEPGDERKGTGKGPDMHGQKPALWRRRGGRRTWRNALACRIRFTTKVGPRQQGAIQTKTTSCVPVSIPSCRNTYPSSFVMGETPTNRSYRATPGRLVIVLLVAEATLWLSDRLSWPAWHKGYAVLVALAGVGLFVLLVPLCFLGALILRWRFQFSIRSLFILTVAVAFPFSWLAAEMKKAREQRATVDEDQNVRRTSVLRLGVGIGVVAADTQCNAPGTGVAAEAGWRFFF